MTGDGQGERDEEYDSESEAWQKYREAVVFSTTRDGENITEVRLERNSEDGDSEIIAVSEIRSKPN